MERKCLFKEENWRGNQLTMLLAVKLQHCAQKQCSLNKQVNDLNNEELDNDEKLVNNEQHGDDQAGTKEQTRIFVQFFFDPVLLTVCWAHSLCG